MQNPAQKLPKSQIKAPLGNCISQIILATLALVVLLIMETLMLHVAIVVAMASSIFTVFVVPNSVASTPSKVIGGHIAGVLSGFR